MSEICPWWLGWILASPIRKLWQDPRTILRPYVADGMTVLEPGPGMGFFTLELARLVGARGRVVVVEVQPRMLQALQKRAHRAGLGKRIDARLGREASLGIDDLAGCVDFVLAFAVVHELPDAGSFFREAHAALRPGGRLLVAEPRLHVREAALARMLQWAQAAGFVVESRPGLPMSRSALLVKR